MNDADSNNERPLIKQRETKEHEFGRDIGLDSISSSESESSGDLQSCKTVYKNDEKKFVISENSSKVLSCTSGPVNLPGDDVNDYDAKSSGDKGDIKSVQCMEGDTELCKDAVEGTLANKKKKKRRFLTICTSNCKYEVVRRVAARFGMKEVTEDSGWNLYWTDLSVSIERAKDMKRFQKLFPRDYNFFPKTWCFPADHGEAMAYSKMRRSKTFIIKPDTGCQGRGIYLTKNLKDVKPTERMICQVYVSRPFLADGYKFDLRIYTLITSCDPLRIYVYNDGLARFATSRYKEPTGHNTSNVFMHLTNYAVNKHSRLYVIDDEIGSKRKISTLNKWLKMKNIDIESLWTRIDEVIIKTILAAYPILKHSYHTCFPTHDKTYACFELLGFDVLLDWKLKPYLLEVNHSPSFHTDAQIDKDVKENLLTDTFDMLNLLQCDKRKIIEEDRRRVRDRLLQGINAKETGGDVASSMAKLEKTEDDYMQRQFKWEDEHMGNFRRIYPSADSEKYAPFFKQTSISVFQDTVASRAREEASRLQKEENEMRIKDQESKKIFGKWSEQKLGPESPNLRKKPRSISITNEKNKILALAKKPSVTLTAKKQLGPATFYTFEPEIISESEERERVTALAQRDFLIKSYGILEQIYMAMKRNGTLRPADERKYGLYGRLGHGNDFSQNASHKCGHCRYPPTTIDARCETLCDRCSRHSLRACKCKAAEEELVKGSCKNLRITCNEAPVYVRPKIPRKFWIEELNSNDQGARITKAHVARTLSNTVRLHTLEKREFLNSKFKNESYEAPLWIK
ncbi:hypothetical protein KM043_005557 [Ampulex compressa]|nr:hypothetical protein KM043_005557 [Ampulex compressa]